MNTFLTCRRRKCGNSSEQEREEIAAQIAEHKRERRWLQKGCLWHHEVPNENYVMWSVVGKDNTEVMGMIFQKFHNPLTSHGRFKLCSLNPEDDYMDKESGRIYGGDELMQVGITVPLEKKDFHTFLFHFVKVDQSYDKETLDQ